MTTKLGTRFAVLAASLAVAVGGAQHSATVAELLRQFQRATDFSQQLDVARQIARSGDASVLKQLEPWLTQEDRHLRGNAAYVFASLGDRRGLEAIGSILTDRSARVVRPEYFGGNPSVAAQIRSDRYYAVHLLGELKDPRTVRMLVALLDDEDVNENAVWALGQIGDAGARQALIDALGNRAASVRVCAIEAIVKLRATDALPKLRELLADHAMPFHGEQVTVAERARAAIAKLQKEP